VSWLAWIADVLGAARYEQHAICLTNDPMMIGIYTTSDLTIWISYMLIGAALVVSRRRGIVPRPIAFDLFASFIAACGLTHFTKVITLYTGIYRLDVLVTLATAVISGFTAFYTLVGVVADDGRPR
jgi:two-component system, LuxR family, sensor kinase FixL